jgi:hypothetical protein
MRVLKVFFPSWILTVIAAAILIFLVYLGVGWIVDGYLGGNMVPDSAVPENWAAPDSWSEWRDITIVLMGSLAVIALLLTIVLLMVLVVLAVTLRRILQNNLRPAIDSLRDSLDNLRGTTEFAGETVVTPIIRVYSVVRGVRSGLSAVKNAPRFMRRSKGD